MVIGTILLDGDDEGTRRIGIAASFVSEALFIIKKALVPLHERIELRRNKIQTSAARLPLKNGERFVSFAMRLREQSTQVAIDADLLAGKVTAGAADDAAGDDAIDRRAVALMEAGPGAARTHGLAS